VGCVSPWSASWLVSRADLYMIELRCTEAHLELAIVMWVTDPQLFLELKQADLGYLVQSHTLLEE
jgi:hypothetical protein